VDAATHHCNAGARSFASVLLIHGRQGSWFVRKTALDAVTVGDRSFAVDGILEDRAWQADSFDLVVLHMIENALAGFNTSLICYSQVSLDFVKSLYAKFIYWDEDMYDLENDTPAHASNFSAAISEDLGQVEYILTNNGNID